MSRKIAINGFGRIGRMVFRILENDADLEVVAINDLTEPKVLAHLLKYDSVHGAFDGKVEVVEDGIVVNGRKVRVTAIKNPAELPWKEMGVELVLECTGVFRTGPKCKAHIDAGAKKVIISAPGKEIDKTIVVGVNDETYDADKHVYVSNGSCTTNCLAPVAKVIDKVFGIENGLMTTIHSYTNDQRILDLPHSDLRRARAAAMSMIPTSTGAASAVGEVLPNLKGKLDGMAIRVPTPNVSVVDVVFNTKKPVSVESVNAALKAASEGELKGILGYTDEELVSGDFNNNSNSSIVDSKCTKIMGDHMVKILSWYDNEWGFSNRMVDLTKIMLGVKKA